MTTQWIGSTENESTGFWRNHRYSGTGSILAVRYHLGSEHAVWFGHRLHLLDLAGSNDHHGRVWQDSR